MASPNQISVAQLGKLVGTPDCPPIIDLCIDEDFNLDPRMVPGAIRHDFRDVDGLAARARDGKLILYCQKGLKISLGCAAMLQERGIDAEALEGGQFAWREADVPILSTSALPPRDGDGRTVWVTRHRPKIDRIACPWLLRRFVDPAVRILFVPPQQVMAVAEKFDATPFDLEGVTFGHRADTCTFDTMLAEFGLESDALTHMAAIIRGADTGKPDLTPQSAGLLALSLGLSRMYRNDHDQLDQGMVLYDALYRWARDARDEGHAWPEVSARV